MKNRIKQIRKDANVSQEVFAQSIGLSRIHIAQVETDKATLSERSVRDICRIYNVNEEWLKDGTGEMYKPRSENEIIANFVNEVMEARSEDFRKRLINALSQLDEAEWQVLEELANKMK